MGTAAEQDASAWELWSHLGYDHWVPDSGSRVLVETGTEWGGQYAGGATASGLSQEAVIICDSVNPPRSLGSRGTRGSGSRGAAVSSWAGPFVPLGLTPSCPSNGWLETEGLYPPPPQFICRSRSLQCDGSNGSGLWEVIRP